MAIKALSDFRQAKEEKNEAGMQRARQVLDENMPYFGYGYIKDPNSIVPNVWLSFWAFRVMVGLGMYFILFFIVILFLSWKHQLSKAIGCIGLLFGVFRWPILQVRRDG